MSFNIHVWRGYYNEIKKIGAMLADTTGDEYIALEEDIKDLIKMCTAYLNHNNIKMPTALWQYDAKDKETWLSSDKFSYQNYLK